MEPVDKIIDYANLHSKYYQTLWKNTSNNTERFEAVSKTTKGNIHEHKMEILSDEYVNILFKSLRVKVTSGTSGKPMEIYWNPDDALRSNVCLWRRRKKYYNITPKDKFCSLHTTTYTFNRVGKLEKIIHREKEISFCKLQLDDDSLMAYYEAMKEFEPKWLFVQPSFLTIFIDFMRRYYLPIPSDIRYIELTGEILTNVVRKNIEETFKCPVANMYGCMETNGIAYECPYHYMHILDDNVKVDIENGTDKGNVLITSLTNRTFPLIKYEVGDVVKITKNYKCKCGSTGTVINTILGRTTKQIRLSNDSVLNEATVAFCIDRTESIVNIGVSQYKAVYRDEMLEIFISIAENKMRWIEEFTYELNKQFHYFYPEIEIRVNIGVDKSFVIANSNSKYSILEVE